MAFLTTSSASGVMGFLTKGAGSKLITYVVIIWILTAAATFITSYLPSLLPRSMLSDLPGNMFYFLNMLLVPQWITTRISVGVTRWALSMIPLIGPKV